MKVHARRDGKVIDIELTTLYDKIKVSIPVSQSTYCIPRMLKMAFKSAIDGDIYCELHDLMGEEE